jgi:glycosyltransferase involved in cell wall biosynthesis
VPTPSVSVVIPSYNEGEYLLATVASVLAHADGVQHEIVVVDDGSTDGSPGRLIAAHSGDARVRIIQAARAGVARARNLGAQHARGEYLAFLDAHCETSPGWLEALIAPLRDSSVGLIGPALASPTAPGRCGYGVIWRDPSQLMTWLPRQADGPYAVPLVCGACQVTRRTDFLRLGGYDGGMTRWGCEDHELSLRFWLMGYRVMIHPDVVVQHLFRDVHPYRVEWYGILFNILRMTLMHMSPRRVTAVLDYYHHRPELGASLHDVLGSGVLAIRSQLNQTRVRTDDWWFAQFGVWG